MVPELHLACAAVPTSIRLLIMTELQESERSPDWTASSIGAQIVLQRVRNGTFKCEGISGLPVFRHAVIRFAAGGTDAEAECDDLYSNVRQFLLSLSSTAHSHPAACASTGPRTTCSGIADPSCLKVLVLVGNEDAPIPQKIEYENWLRAGDGTSVLPVVPATAVFSSVVPWEPLNKRNAYIWTERVGDAAAAVVALAGVAPEDNRLFVSYIRKEADPLAVQVFHALAERGFDVFVDRFRVPPGVDFQQRLSDELAHKAMILVLESKSILRSPWVEHELSFAKKHALGHLALHLPGGARVPHIDDGFREELEESDLIGTRRPGSRKLHPSALARVVRRIIDEHARAHTRRRTGLRTSLAAALAQAGISNQDVDREGYLRVAVQDAEGVRRYTFWATPRPAEVEDFLVTHGGCRPAPCPTGVIVAPAGFEEPRRRRRTEWLADVSSVRIRSSTDLNSLAEDVRSGTI